MVRILLLSNLYPPHILGGAEIVAADAAMGLERLGHEVTVLTSSYGLSKAQQDGHIWRTLKLAPATHFDRYRPIWQQLNLPYNYYQGYHSAANANMLRHVINTTHPEVLFICELTGIGAISLLSALHEFNIPIIFYLQSYLLLYANSPETEQSQFRARWLKKLLIGSLPPLTYTSLIAVSNALKQEYTRAGYDPERIEVIYNGVDSRFLKPLPTKHFEEREINNPLASAKKCVQLLYVGRLRAEKGILVILKALDLLVNGQGRQDLHLNIFGDGDKAYVSELQSFIRDKRLLQAITFHGRIPQDELIDHYDRSEIILVPSLWQEPFALVTAEAMARGVAVIASKVGGTGERITDRVNGRLVKPGDELALAGAIAQMIDHPDIFESISRAARTTIEERFTVEEFARHIEHHIQKVFQKNQSIDTKK